VTPDTGIDGKLAAVSKSFPADLSSVLEDDQHSCFPEYLQISHRFRGHNELPQFVLIRDIVRLVIIE